MSNKQQANLLEVRGLTVDYLTEKAKARALENVSFKVAQGSILGIVGESGCGKTTLMLALLRLLPQAGRIVAGEVLFNGRDLLRLSENDMRSLRWQDLAIIFQGAMNALNPVKTVEDQITEVLLRQNPNKTSAAKRVDELLEMVGIGRNRKGQYPHQFSGGMRQRAMIAMALACNPKLVIADEPTTALDVMVQAQILELLLQLRAELDLTILLVTHDLGVVAEVCDTALVMYGGVIAEHAPIDAIFNAPSHPYTQALLGAFPDHTKPKTQLLSIPGYPPKLDALPPGCRFAPRCSQVIDICQLKTPSLIKVSDGFASCHLLETL
ncbi:MAG: ABC transporter ATP-binding protein [Trueperaceae bacterium]|nr:ABC transporter ATP-binding protein [Trueperaceae bacterium]